MARLSCEHFPPDPQSLLRLTWLTYHRPDLPPIPDILVELLLQVHPTGFQATLVGVTSDQGLAPYHFLDY